MSSWQSKLDRMRDLLRETGGCAVAYSGGVDSSVVLAAAREVLGDRCLAVIATSSTYARREYEAAIKWLECKGIPHAVIVSEELDIPEFSGNPPDRCYYCKRELFSRIIREARARGLGAVVDGTNADDVNDHRPGMRAAREIGVLSPLKEVGLTKQEIRDIARVTYRLPMADKPSMACLASRFPYGEAITRERLSQVERVECLLQDLGFSVCRARHHGNTLRIELGPSGYDLILRPDIRWKCVEYAKALGFAYVTLDLEGFRSGSMNEALEQAS